MGKKSVIIGLFGLILLLAGCERHSEAEVRAQLTRWFALGETVYFKTTYDCTAAMFKVQTDQMKSALQPNSDAGTALFQYGRSGMMVLANPTQKPNDGFLELMNMDRPIGIAMQAASVLGKKCMDENMESAFFYAMQNPKATMVFSREDMSMVLMDPGTRLVIFASGGAE
ncbi:MAG: hypothetical protein Q9M48_01795 [Rhodobacterales bacterium]|nr:hypothetical protein [Rhodobacterales bacterium]